MDWGSRNNNQPCGAAPPTRLFSFRECLVLPDPFMPPTPEPPAHLEPAPKPDLSQWELPSSEPEPVSRQASPSGASAVKPATAESPSPAPAKHSSRSLRLAAHLGISQSEIDAFSRDDLLHEIRAAQAEQEQIAMEGRRGRGLDAQERPAPKPEPTEPPLWAEHENEWEEDDPEHPGQKRKMRMAEAELARPVAKLLRQMRKELAETKDKLDAKDKASAASSREQEIDAAFNALPEEYKVAFGTGSLRDLLAANDPAVSLRQAVWAHLVAHPPKESLSPKEAVAQRAKALYGRLLEGQTTTPATPETNLYDQSAPGARPTPAPRPAVTKNPATGRFEANRPTEEEWEEAPVARPTNRQNAPEPKGPARARAKVKEILRQQSVASGRNGDGNGEEWDELPD